MSVEFIMEGYALKLKQTHKNNFVEISYFVKFPPTLKKNGAGCLPKSVSWNINRTTCTRFNHGKYRIILFTLKPDVLNSSHEPLRKMELVFCPGPFHGI